MGLEKEMLVRDRLHGDIRTSGIFITEDGKKTFHFPKKKTEFIFQKNHQSPFHLQFHFLHFHLKKTTKPPKKKIGVAKFYDPNLMDYKQTAYTKTLLGKTRCPLAPELLVHLKARESSPAFDKQPAEVWSIGVLMASLATLSAEEVLYDWRATEIDRRGYEHALQQIKGRYSPLFYELVSKCLSFDSRARPSLPDILRYINTRKSSI